MDVPKDLINRSSTKQPSPKIRLKAHGDQLSPEKNRTISPNSRYIRLLASFAVILSLVVVMLGAYTRLTDAGLGCPDWPGCYGHFVLPDSPKALEAAQQSYPDTLIEPQKAWTEMIHRYGAGTLLGFILILTGYIFKRRREVQFTHLVYWTFGLTALVVFQALLGMWTVTLKLLPVVVMGHLLGGILIFSILCRIRFQLTQKDCPAFPQDKIWVRLGALIVFCQIALGGWVSANYAGIACLGFPQCNGEWFPPLYFSEGLNLFSAVGENYQGGLLDHEVRVTIHWIHRIGALLTLTYLLFLSFRLLNNKPSRLLTHLATFIVGLVILQFTLGIINVIYLLPVKIAVLHNGVAALLMATLFVTLACVRGKPGQPRAMAHAN